MGVSEGAVCCLGYGRVDGLVTGRCLVFSSGEGRKNNSEVDKRSGLIPGTGVDHTIVNINCTLMTYWHYFVPADAT